MKIVAYPNNEIRVRIPPVVTKRHSERVSPFVGVPAPPNLIIAKNLRFSEPDSQRPPQKIAIERPGYGAIPKGVRFSSRGRHLMMRSGALLGNGSYGNDVVFLTGTLPGGTPEAMAGLAQYSSWVVHQLLTSIPRMAGVLPSETRLIWCWEYQKRGALHWHCLIKLPDFKSRDKVLIGFHSLWCSTLRGVAKKTGVDIFERLDGGTWEENPELWQTKAIKADSKTSRYLAKYVGKNSAKEGIEFFPPTRWYGINHSLHKEYRESVVHVETHENHNRHVVTSDDVAFLELCHAASSTSHKYQDKYGSGTNFIYYIEEGKMAEIKNRIEGFEYKMKRLHLQKRYEVEAVRRFPALTLIATRSWLAQRFFDDIGMYYQAKYTDFLNETIDIDDDDVWWLNHYAKQLCIRLGLSYQVNAPQRSGAGLTGQSNVESEPLTAPPEFEQSSLFP